MTSIVNYSNKNMFQVNV